MCDPVHNLSKFTRFESMIIKFKFSAIENTIFLISLLRSCNETICEMWTEVNGKVIPAVPIPYWNSYFIVNALCIFIGGIILPGS